MENLKDGKRKGLTIYNTVYDYLQNFKVGDKIILAGYGMVDGTKTVHSKHDTYTVTERTNSTYLSIKAYRGRTYLTLRPDYYNQQIAVISQETFENLSK